MARQVRTTTIWKSAFVKALAKDGSVTDACRCAGIGRQTAYSAREVDPVFRADWDDAIEQAIDSLERIAFKRAKKQSDKLLMFLLSSRRRTVYGQRQVHQHEGGIVVQTIRGIDERAALGDDDSGTDGA